MTTRKVFSDDDERMELTYHLIDGKLVIEIIEEDVSSEIMLEYSDAIQFISELNRIKKLLKIPEK